MNNIYLTKSRDGHLFAAKLLAAREKTSNGETFDTPTVLLYTVHSHAAPHDEILAPNHLAGTRLDSYSLENFMALNTPVHFASNYHVLDAKTLKEMQRHFAVVSDRSVKTVVGDIMNNYGRQNG